MEGDEEEVVADEFTFVPCGIETRYPSFFKFEISFPVRTKFFIRKCPSLNMVFADEFN